MAEIGGPNIVTDGLVFAIDAGSTRSYIGSGTTTNSLVSDNIGTLVNGTGFNSDNGGSWTSDGVDDGITVPDASNLDLSTFSIEVWVNFDLHKNFSSIMTKTTISNDADFFNYGFFCYSTAIQFFIGDGGDGTRELVLIDLTTLPINSWHCMVGTYDGSIMRFYVDGEQEGTNSTTITPYQNTGTLRIIDPSFSIDGKVSIGRVYDRALTATEVTHNYDVIKARFD